MYLLIYSSSGRLVDALLRRIGHTREFGAAGRW
jgi:hypothetical protein